MFGNVGISCPSHETLPPTIGESNCWNIPETVTSATSPFIPNDYLQHQQQAETQAEEYITSFLLCSNVFAIRKCELGSENIELTFERANLVKNLCFHLQLERNEIPSSCNKVNFPLYLGCEEELRMIWAYQQRISESVSLIQTRLVEYVREGRANQPMTPPLSPLFETLKFTKLRDIIVQGHYNKHINVVTQAGAHPPTQNETPQSTYSVLHPHSQVQYGVPLDLNNIMHFIPQQSDFLERNMYETWGNATASSVGGNTDIPTSSFFQNRTNYICNPSLGVNPGNDVVPRAAYPLLPNEKGDHNIFTPSIMPPMRNLPNQYHVVVKQEEQMTQKTYEDDEDILQLRERKRKVCRNGVEIYRCQKVSGEEFFNCSLCTYSVPIPKTKINYTSKGFISPMKVMQIHIQSEYKNHPNFTQTSKPNQQAISIAYSYFCPVCQNHFLFLTKELFDEHKITCSTANYAIQQQFLHKELPRGLFHKRRSDAVDEWPSSSSSAVEIKHELIRFDADDDDDVDSPEIECAGDTPKTNKTSNISFHGRGQKVSFNGVEIIFRFGAENGVDYLLCGSCGHQLLVPKDTTTELMAEKERQMEKHIKSLHIHQFYNECENPESLPGL